MAIESSPKKYIEKKDYVEMAIQVKLESTSESTTLRNDNNTFSYEDEAYYSIINVPVLCKPNERVDFRGICRVVYN